MFLSLAYRLLCLRLCSVFVQQLWFKLIVPARHGNPRVEAANLPFPPVANGDPYLTAEVMEGVSSNEVQLLRYLT